MAYEQLKLKNQLCFRLYTASRLITQTYEPFLQQLGITYTQYLVLMVLWENDGLPINDIGRRLYLGINTMSPLIKRMEKMALLERRSCEEDKRQQLVFLTKAGKAMQKEAAKVPGCMGDTMQEHGLDLDGMVGIAPMLDEIIDKLG